MSTDNDAHSCRILALVTALLLTPLIVAVHGSSMCGCEHAFPTLMEFYSATNGDGWLDHSGWGNMTNCSNWFGLTCSASEVESMILSNNNLTGTLPSSLSLLTHFLSVLLNGNHIRGTLPASYASWRSLITFNASTNSLMGSLPPEYGAGWPQMLNFQVHSNALSGTLPQSYANWVVVAIVTFSNNALSGTLPPEYGVHWNSIQNFQVYSNQLTGTFPPEYSLWGSALHYFYVSHNQLIGTLPLAYRLWTNLQDFVVNNNKFSGTLPPEYAGWTNAVRVYVEGNELAGILPPEYQSWALLSIFHAGSNQLVGPLPREYGAWTMLTDFEVQSNLHLDGTLPVEYALWNNLVYFYVNGNDFTGHLPPEFTNWTYLLHFVIDDNFLSGSLHASYGAAWGELTDFSVANNLFNGTLPAEYRQWMHLTNFFVYSNDFEGTMPHEYSNWTKLQRFVAYGNNLSGTLPREWSTWRSLSIFQAYGNSLTSTLPPEYSEWGSSMVHFFVHVNRINGTLPSSYSNWTSLYMFFAGANSISGTLPPAYSAWRGIYYFQVESNQISGTLPPEYGSWRGSVSNFFVADNQLTGTLPPSYKNWTTISKFYCYSNQLNGTLPAEYSAMTTMTTFYAHTNRFTGSLPPQYGAWTMLTQIDVSFNMLTGTLPDDYRLWAGIQDIVVKSNMLTGVVPVTWGVPSFANLRLLNVEDTCLKGWLPASVLSSVATLKICNTHIIERTNCATAGGSWPAFCPNETKTVSLSSSMTGTEGSHSLKAGSETASRSAHTHTISRSAHTRTISRSAPTRTTSRNAYTPTAPMSVSLLRCTPYESTANVAMTLTAPLATLPPRSTASSLAVALSSLMPVETNVSFVPSSALPSPPPPPLVVITTTPIARSTLVQAPEFVFNLSFTAPANAVRWTVTNVVYQTTPAGSTPNDNNVTLDWSSSSTVTNDASTVTSTVLVVQPPRETGVWLLSNAGVLVGQTLSLRIAFACGGEEVLVVELQIPAPGYPQQLASQVEAATRYSQVASALAGGASSGTALGRVMAIRSMVVCDADASVGGGVLDFGLQLCPISADTDVARSAVVSNVVVLACVFVFLLLLSCLWAHARGVSLRSALLVFSMPSSAYPACLAVLPSTAAAVALLIARVNSSTCVGLDATLIVLGLVVVVGCPFALTTLFIRRANVEPLHWECRLQPLRQNKSRPRSLYGRLIQPYAAVVLHRAWKWYALSDTGRDPLKRSWVVLLEYRVLWFAALDSGMLVVIAVLAVVGGLDATDSSLCRSVVLVVLALTVCQMLLMLLLRPYTTLFSVVHGAVTLALTSLSIAAQIAFIVSSTTESPHLWLVKASAGCDLAVVGVTAVKMMFDSKDVVDAIRRRLNGNVGVDDSDHIPRDLSIMTLTLINADHDDALVVNYATQSSSTTSLSHRDVVEGSSASGMREDRVSYRSSSTTSSPCSPPMALRSHSAGNSFALSSSFHLERVNARFWDSNGTAHVLRGGEGGASGFVIDGVFDHKAAEM